MTEGEAEEYQKKFGINPRRMANRLQGLKKMGFQGRQTAMTAEDRSEMETRRQKYGNLKVTQPNNESFDLFEINKMTNIADVLVDGDTVLTEEQLNKLEEDLRDANSTGRVKRQMTVITDRKWTHNTLYYYMDSTVDANTRQAVPVALAYLQARTCINFVQSSTAQNRVKVTSGDGCYSFVGMAGNEQVLSLGTGCGSFGTITHEFLHALGFYHEQSRSDRDSYVRIDLTNVPSSRQSNFNKYSSDRVANYVPYEYGSNMHYSVRSFVNKTGAFSVEPLDDDYLFTAGSRQVSLYDLININTHYGCSCPANSVVCQNGGVPNPRSCNTCNCPLGYGGATCAERPAGCGSSLTATANWQTTTMTVGDSSNSASARNSVSYCTSWITAPAGMQVQVRISEIYNGQCNFGCSWNGIELKIKSDKKLVSPRFCCDESKNQIYTSQLNPTPIIAFNQFYSSQFKVDYRYVSAGGISPASSTPGPVTGAPSTCVDSSGASTCAQWNSQGFCSSTFYTTDQKKQYCQNTCNLCNTAPATSGPNGCVDNSGASTCAYWNSQGFCSSSSYPTDLKKQHCQNTCKLC